MTRKHAATALILAGVTVAVAGATWLLGALVLIGYGVALAAAGLLIDVDA